MPSPLSGRHRASNQRLFSGFDHALFDNDAYLSALRESYKRAAETKPAPEAPKYKIRYVIRWDNKAGGVTSFVEPSSPYTKPEDKTFGYTNDLQRARLFSTANAAAEAISDRSKYIRSYPASYTGRLFSIVPVREEGVPATTTTEPRVITINDKAGTPVRELRVKDGVVQVRFIPGSPMGGGMWFGCTFAHKVGGDDFKLDLTNDLAKYNVPAILDLFENPTVTTSVPATRTITLA